VINDHCQNELYQAESDYKDHVNQKKLFQPSEITEESKGG